MSQLSRLFFTLLLLALAADRSRAEGLVQLGLHGAVESRGGASVELEWHHWNGSEVRDTALRLHLAQDTSAFDFASLVVARLRARGARVHFPAEHSGAAGPVNVFVEDTVEVKLRLGSGMWGSVTLCDQGPEKVRFLRPLLEKEGAQLSIRTSTFETHAKQPGSVLLELDVDRLASTPSVSEQLFNHGLRLGLVCDRPSADSWRPVKGSDGALITGCSIELLSPGTDWGLEVSLRRPSGER